MGFPKQTPGVFNKESLEGLTPNEMGCYGLYRKGVWVYVGKGDIRQRLLEHLGGDNPCITREQPTHWVGSVISDYDNEEKRLI